MCWKIRSTRPITLVVAAFLSQLNPFRWRPAVLRSGSLSRRLMIVATAWIIPLLLFGGWALDETITKSLTRNFDRQIKQYLESMIAAAEIDEVGEVRFTRALGDQRFFEQDSGLYWQVNVPGQKPFKSRSLWDRTLPLNMAADHRTEHTVTRVVLRDERTGSDPERLRIIDQDIRLPRAKTAIRFAVAANIEEVEEQIARFRRTLFRSLGVTGLGLIFLSAFQATYGLSPLRAVRRGLEAVKTGRAKRLAEAFPPEIQPLANEMNDLLDHSDKAAEQARTHAGNLAHALKTPMAVLLNEARTNPANLADTVTAQVEQMQRHVDHHLARARALAQRATLGLRTAVWPSLQSLKRTLEKIYQDKDIIIEITGDDTAQFRGEKQDLEEVLGNLLDNACKYGGPDVRVTVKTERDFRGETFVHLTIEDSGVGIPESHRERLFQRGARLDTDQAGTGLGLAIVRDVTELYGGRVELSRSAEFEGLQVNLWLPAATA
jgi:signal transduction histidine kinase